MECYKNLSGNSGVAAYAIGDDFIWVQFSDGTRYQYTYDRPGIVHVETMKQLAIGGRGLNSYIQRTPVVRKGYFIKER
ncbi:hypothetical protein FHX57_002113 [Paraburkholderia tropica]|nr:hypothetical protein [Paraburkholderia tropica]